MKIDTHSAINILEELKRDVRTEEKRTALELAIVALVPRTLCVEVSGGVVQEVHGIRPGDNYTLADYDDEEMDSTREDNCDFLIAQAKAQNK